MTIKRVALVAPNFAIREAYGGPSDPPIGVLSIAAVLEQRGFMVSVIDANAGNLSDGVVIEQLRASGPQLVGISCNYSPLHNPTIRLATAVKQVLGRELSVAVGGNHATAAHEYVLRSSQGAVDYICKGEGETSLVELVEGINSGTPPADIRGISFFAQGGTVQSNDCAPVVADLNGLPVPAYHLAPMNQYKRYNIISSRGCPYVCTYCASKVVATRVRYRSPVNVVDEIEHLLRTYGQRHFWFSDDTFTANVLHSIELMDEIVRRRLSITWSCLTRVNVTSRDLLRKMKASGCTYVSYGVESGDREILNRMDKRITLDAVRQALTMTREEGLRMYTFFLVGYPGETRETIERSYDLIRETRPDGASFAIVIPLPGTRLFDELFAKGLISLDEIKWDYLFAKVPGKYEYEQYAAQLASRWCSLSPKELIDACSLGENLLSS